MKKENDKKIDEKVKITYLFAMNESQGMDWKKAYSLSAKVTEADKKDNNKPEEDQKKEVENNEVLQH